jgi:hypothetical protein
METMEDSPEEEETIASKEFRETYPNTFRCIYLLIQS